MLRILVEDDGVGPSFDDSDSGFGFGSNSGSGSGEGHGILGMRERAVALGGALRAGARPGGGFQVQVTLPAPESTPA